MQVGKKKTGLLLIMTNEKFAPEVILLIQGVKLMMHNQVPKKPKEKLQINVYLNPKLYRILVAIANKEQKSLSQVIRYLLVQALKEQDQWQNQAGGHESQLK